MEALKSDLVSFTKLDRDRALQDLEAAVGGGNHVFSISETDLRFFSTIYFNYSFVVCLYF